MDDGSRAKRVRREYKPSDLNGTIRLSGSESAFCMLNWYEIRKDIIRCTLSVMSDRANGLTLSPSKSDLRIVLSSKNPGWNRKTKTVTLMKNEDRYETTFDFSRNNFNKLIKTLDNLRSGDEKFTSLRSCFESEYDTPEAIALYEKNWGSNTKPSGRSWEMQKYDKRIMDYLSQRNYLDQSDTHEAHLDSEGKPRKFAFPELSDITYDREWKRLQFNGEVGRFSQCHTKDCLIIEGHHQQKGFWWPDIKTLCIPAAGNRTQFIDSPTDENHDVLFEGIRELKLRHQPNSQKELNRIYRKDDSGKKESVSPEILLEGVDPNVQAVVQSHIERAKAGLAKYGVDTTRTDLTGLQWVTHLQEELMDAAIYAERIKKNIESADFTQLINKFTIERGIVLPDIGGDITKGVAQLTLLSVFCDFLKQNLVATPENPKS